jgi:tetratricopeptide (TPR) repeat protein/TolB-like protein
VSLPPDDPASVFAELKRRKVVRAALVYGAGAFAVLQVADIVAEPLGLPDWVMPALIWLLLIGFAVTTILSWFFDLSDEGAESHRWVSLRAGAVIVGLVGLGLAVGWVLRPALGGGYSAAPNPASGDVVVVLPFSVLGSPDTHYLSEAVAKLLSSSIDGIAGLRTVSSHALLGHPALQNGAVVTETLAQEVAEHFGAGLWLLGDVLQSGDSVRIEAVLVGGEPNGDSRASASVTTGTDDLFSAVDQLAALLVAEREAGVGSARTRTAALTTTSLDALKAYIAGERAFRSGSYLPAVESFSQAVTADTSFALAFYRLSMTEERLAWAEASRRSAEAAYRYAERLSSREREFLEAVVALRRGNTYEAEQMLRTHVRVHPDDPEAWYQLGEILFHGEPLRGGSMTAGREPLESALFYDPGDLGALYHLVRIAIKDGDTARLDSLTARFVALSPSGERTLELRALRAASQGDSSTFEQILDEMTESPDPFLPIAVWSVAVFGQEPSLAESIAQLMTGADRPTEIRGAGYVQLAHLALAQGRYADALTHLDQAEALGDPDAQEARIWLATLPFLETTDEALRDASAELSTRDSGPIAESPRSSSFFSAQNGVHRVVSGYLRGLIAARLGDQGNLTEAAEVLEAEGGTAGAQVLARQLAVGVRAQGLLRSGQPEQALRLLSDLRVEGWYELTFVSPYYSAALERFTLAELLFQQGRDEVALGWYQGLRENNVAELVFLGPALLREATIHRRAGRESMARQLKARFDHMWASSDPELREAVLARFGS